MDKKAYFLGWLKNRLFRKRRNIIRMFAININKQSDFEMNPVDKMLIDSGKTTYEAINPTDYQLAHNGISYFTMIGDKRYELGPYNTTTPFINHLEKIMLEPGDLPNITEQTETTYGVLFLNYYCFIDIVGDKFPYINKHMDSCVRLEEQLFSHNRLPVDDPTYLDVGTEINPCRNRLQQLGTFTTLFVPAATRKILSVPKEIIVKRDVMLKQYRQKDGSYSVADITMIQNELKQEMKKYVESDVDYGGLITNRSWGNTLMGMNVMVGAVQRFDKPGTYDVIPGCFSDGINAKTMVSMVNISRAGSFYRGYETQLAGVEVKVLQRVIDNRITIEDCGTTRYQLVEITDTNFKSYKGRYHMVNGVRSLVTEECIGKVINLRSPTCCKAPNPNLCLTCMGELFRGYSDKVPVMASQPGSDMLNNMMKAMHDTTIRLTEYDPFIAFH